MFLSNLYQLGIIAGIQSVLIKSVTAFIRLFFIAFLCHHLSPPLFLNGILFLGFISMTPFFDMGIGGSYFRRKSIEFILNEEQEKKKVLFFICFSKLLRLYVVIGLVGSGLILCIKNFPIHPLAFFLSMIRVPFNVIIDALFAESKMGLAYAIEILEQMLLLFSTMIILQAFPGSSFQLSYSLTLFIFTVFSFSLFLKKKKWSFVWISSPFRIEKQEFFHGLQSFFSSSFLVFIPAMMNLTLDVDEVYEFNIAFRILTVLLGASMVLFNPIWNRLLIQQQKEGLNKLGGYLIFLFVMLFLGSTFLVFSYEKVFYLIGGFYPTDSHLIDLMIYLGCLLFLFLGLDQILKTICIKRSIVMWLTFYLGWGLICSKFF
jgi:hypothetical protein